MRPLLSEQEAEESSLTANTARNHPHETRLGRRETDRLTLGAVPNGWRLALDSGETYTVDRTGMARLLFYGPQLDGDGELKRILGLLFPMPFVFTKNLNFV